MSATLVLKRDDAVRVIQDLLLELGPQVKIEIQQSNHAITLHARAEGSELIEWAKRIGDRYQNVFERLA